MRRLGPLYGGMIAIASLTRVPLPRELAPAPEDAQRSAAWFPAVGGLIGVSMAGVAAVLATAGLVPATAGVAAIMAGLALTRGMQERGLARVAELAARSTAGRAEERERHLAGVLAVSAVLVLRALGLLGVAVDWWLAALVVAPVVGRWCPLAVALIAPRIGLLAPAAPERARSPLLPGEVSLVSASLATGVTVVLAAWLGRGTGLVAVLVGAGVYTLALWLAQRRTERDTGHEPAAASTLAELAALLVFAALHPPAISPWITP